MSRLCCARLCGDRGRGCCAVSGSMRCASWGVPGPLLIGCSSYCTCDTSCANASPSTLHVGDGWISDARGLVGLRMGAGLPSHGSTSYTRRTLINAILWDTGRLRLLRVSCALGAACCEVRRRHIARGGHTSLHRRSSWNAAPLHLSWTYSRSLLLVMELRGVLLLLLLMELLLSCGHSARSATSPSSTTML